MNTSDRFINNLHQAVLPVISLQLNLVHIAAGACSRTCRISVWAVKQAVQFRGSTQFRSRFARLPQSGMSLFWSEDSHVQVLWFLMLDFQNRPVVDGILTSTNLLKHWFHLFIKDEGPKIRADPHWRSKFTNNKQCVCERKNGWTRSLHINGLRWSKGFWNRHRHGAFRNTTCVKWVGYGSIPINSIFRGMNIHLPAILMWTTGVQGFDTLPVGFHDSLMWIVIAFLEGIIHKELLSLGYGGTTHKHP